MYIATTTDSVVPLPDAPRNVQGFYDYDADLVQVDWQPPNNSADSKINSYIIERSLRQDGGFKEIGCVDFEVCCFEDGDILEDAEYFYRILALNENGTGQPSNSTKVSIKWVVDLPDAPEGPLHVTNTTSCSCSLSWRAPISGPVPGYSVWKRRQDMQIWTRIVTVDGDVHEHTVGNLDNHYRYNFKIHSENRAGSSLVALKASSLVYLKTGTRKPNAPRGPLTPTVTGPSSMYIEYGGCENDGGAPIRGYKIWIKEVTRKIWIEVGTVDPDVGIFTVRDLVEGRAYLVKVAAFNELGIGPPLVVDGPVAIIRPEGVVVPPSAPVGPVIVKNISPTSLMVSWKPPCEDGGASIEAYIIEQSEILETDIVKTHHETDGAELFYVANDLTQGHYYCFRIYAVNEAGVGEALVGRIPTRAKAASVRPPQPKAPVVEIYDKKLRTVKVSWIPVEGCVDCYLVERSRLDEEDWQLVSPQTNFQETTLLCGGLFPAVEYVFRVSAESHHGIGKASRISEPIAVSAGNICQPQFCKDLKDVTALAGDLIQFEVEFCGEPDPEIVWMHDETPVLSEGRFEVLSIDGASSLRISPVMMEDEGGVTCEANNSAGKSRTDARLSVHARPEILSVARYSEGLSFDAGDSLSITLPYVGSPKPEAVWLLNGKPLDLNLEGVRVSFDCGNAVLYIKELATNLQGIYSLKIDNRYGSAKLDIAVSVTGEPEQPSELYLTDIQDDNCVLHWKPPNTDGGSPITNYLIEKQEEGDTAWVRCAASQTSKCRIFDLCEGGIVAFRVLAVNILGQSRPSAPSIPTRMLPHVKYQEFSPGPESVPSSSVSAVGIHQDSVFQDISEQEQEHRPEIRPEFWATPDLTSPDSCVPETLVGGSQPNRDWEEAATVADDTLDSVSELSSFQAENTDYYSASPVGTVTSSNDTVLDMEMSELMNLVSQNSGSDNGQTVLQRLPFQGSPVGVSSVTVSGRGDFISPADSPPLMTVIEALTCQNDIKQNETCEEEVTVLHDELEERKPTSYVDSAAQLHHAEETDTLIDNNLTVQDRNEEFDAHREPAPTSCAEGVYNNSSTRSTGRVMSFDEVAVDRTERSETPMNDSRQVDEAAEPVSQESEKLLISISKAENATDSCIRIMEQCAKAKSTNSSTSDVASLEDSIERDCGCKDQKLETLEADLQLEMTNLERDLRMLKVVHEFDDRFDDDRVSGAQRERYDDRVKRKAPPKPHGQLPNSAAEWKRFRKTLRNRTPEKFYSERTGSICRIPSETSSEDESLLDNCLQNGFSKSCPPKIISHLYNRHIQLGCRVKLCCSIDADPCPEVSWFHNGKPLELKKRYFVMNMVDLHRCTLEIHNVRCTDTGEYSLVAKNSLGECRTSAYLRVTGAREQSPEKPSISREKEIVVARTGDEANLCWTVRGWPLPYVRVYHDHDRVRTDLHKDLLIFGCRGECRLKLHKLSSSDEGVYTCLASNKFGSSATTIVLDVGGDSSSLAAAMDPLGNLSTRNRDRNLPLGFYDPDVTGSPFPEYVEDLFERPVCWFRTHHVPFLRNLQRSVKELPELRKLPWPPLNPKFTEIDRNSVTLCWERPMNDGGSKIYDFKVEARELHTRNWREKATSRSPITTVYGLKPGTTYIFRVAARNKYGEGQAQVSEPVTTKASA